MVMQKLKLHHGSLRMVKLKAGHHHGCLHGNLRNSPRVVKLEV